MTDRPKDEQIEKLFSSISRRYDLLNTILSFNFHKRWRRFAAAQCGISEGNIALDVAAGTFDLSIELSKIVGKDGSIIAADFCIPMFEAGFPKLERLKISNIHPVLCNAMQLPFPSNTFDCASIAFGIRNVTDIQKAVNEMARVVRPGGKVVSLELAKPVNPIFRFIYNIYFYKALPIIGGYLNGYKEYKYLPESLTRFCSRDQFANIMINAGLRDIKVHNLVGGVAAVHSGTKV